MDIILIQDVDTLGGKNEVVKVKNGYARNYLIPRKFAVEANPGNLKQLEERLPQLIVGRAGVLGEDHATRGIGVADPGADAREVDHALGVERRSSLARIRWTASACSWHTRDSVTPRTSPISRKLHSSW